MTQKEKLDKILQVLYREKYTGIQYTIYSVMGIAGLNVSKEEANSLAKRLYDDSLVNGVFHKDGGQIAINSYGIDQCEETSYSSPSTPVINLTINNSPGASITTGANTISCQINTSEASALVEIIKAQLLRSETDQDIIREIGICMDEIVAEVQSGKKPNKFTMKGLLSSTADITTVYPKIQVFTEHISNIIP